MSEEIAAVYQWLVAFVDTHPYDVAFMPINASELVFNEYYADQYSIKLSKPLTDIMYPFFSEERELDEALDYLNHLHRKFAFDDLIETL